jgi:ComF family protein
VRIETVLDALFPPICAGCDAQPQTICEACLPSAAAAQLFSLDSLRVMALGTYDGPLRRAVLRFKHGRRDAGSALASALAERFACELVRQRVLVPVPTTPARRAERGFDQGALLARELGRRSGLGVLEILRQTAGDAQRGRSRSARLDARGRFRCDAAAVVPGLAVVLVDDVVTTGATLRDCRAVLEAAGAEVVGALVVARAL